MQSVLVRPQVKMMRPQGHLNAASATELQSQLNAAVLSERNAALLVDMAQVESLDSAGLMVLVSAHKLAQKIDRRFCLCSVSAPIRIIFELTQLDQAFEIFEHPAAFEASLG